MARYGMVIDLDRCTGCRGCMESCKIENDTPQGTYWMYVFRFEEGEYPATQVRFMSRPCQHCDNAPCVKVCPVGARYKREDGLVATDWMRCIGCRYCEVACPYGVNSFNWGHTEEHYYFDWNAEEVAPEVRGTIPPWDNPSLDEPYGPEQRHIAGGGRLKGVVDKCTFCVQRVENGLDPACVHSCPVRALVFGDLEDPASAPSRLLQSKPSFRLLEDAGTEPRVHYVGGNPPTTETRQIEPAKAEV